MPRQYAGWLIQPFIDIDRLEKITINLLVICPMNITSKA